MTMMYASNNVDTDDDKKGSVDSIDVEEADETSENGTETRYQTWRNQPPREYSPIQIRNRRICYGVFTIILLITGIALLISSMRKVETTEYGVQYNVHKKQLDDAAKSGGLFFGPPGYEFVKFPSTFVTVDLDDRTCISRDGLRVLVSVTFQYQMAADYVLPVITKYRDFDKWAGVVEAAGLSAVHHSCSEFNISDFQNKRGQIQTLMESNLKLKLEGDEDNDLEGVFALAVSLQLRNVGLPELYNAAVAEKQSAEEDIALAKNQRKQERTKAGTQLLQAQEEARKILDTSINEAEVLLTEARLKAEETTFAFEKEAETIVEVKEALNLTTEGVLAYLANSLLAEVQNLKITTGEPAKLSRSNEL
jgi:regulator of protease activity HflC (stomatin/prohibitin superfamily)